MGARTSAVYPLILLAQLGAWLPAASASPYRGPTQHRNAWERQCYERLMSSQWVSNTITDSFRAEHQLAARNYERAVRLVVRNASRLKLDANTACLINRVLLKGIMPQGFWAARDERGIICGNGLGTKKMYAASPQWAWLQTAEAKQLEKADPVAFAERIARASNPEYLLDGNGRTYRLLVSIALMRNGRLPPVFTRAGWFPYMNAVRARNAYRDGRVPESALVDLFRQLDR